MIKDSSILNVLDILNEKKYRLTQINEAIFVHLISSWDDITNIPVSLRASLKEKIHYIDSLSIYKKLQDDQTVKLSLQTKDNKYIETVILKHKLDRNTVCVSTQIGCPLGCKFCATGKMGFIRNLSVEEIVDQVIIAQRILKDEDKKIKNIVFMGMGEPLLNYDNLIEAIKIINDPKKLGIGIRHITISTAGIISMIEKLMEENIQVNLAVSLHCANDTKRSTIMPVNNNDHLYDLIEVLKKYSVATNRRIFYEYIMLANINDSLEDAKMLANLLTGQNAHVNLIPYNVTGDEFVGSSNNQIRRFQKILTDNNIPSTIRVSLGEDIGGACGQLSGKCEDK